ncbi:MAG: HEAT repeat domain-containing protein [Polyangiaceae bacterium]
MNLEKLLRSFLVLGVVGCNQAVPEPAERVGEPSVQSAPATRSEPTPSPSASCDRQRVERLLSAPHDPPSVAELSAACADVAPILNELARDQSARGLVRLRSLESLGELGGAPAVATLSDLATRASELPSVRRTSLLALGKATASGDAERERVGTAALSDSDPHVRRVAAQLLRGSKTASVRVALEQAKTRETTAFVKEELEASLGQR